MYMPVYMIILLSVCIFVAAGSENKKDSDNMYKDSKSVSDDKVDEQYSDDINKSYSSDETNENVSDDNVDEKLSDESHNDESMSYCSVDTDDYKEINIDDNGSKNYVKNNYYVGKYKKKSYESDEKHDDNRKKDLEETLINTLINDKPGRLRYTTTPILDSRDVDIPYAKLHPPEESDMESKKKEEERVEKLKKIVVYTKEWRHPGNSVYTHKPKYIKSTTIKNPHLGGDISIWTTFKTKTPYLSNEDSRPGIKSKKPSGWQKDERISVHFVDFATGGKLIKLNNPFPRDNPSEYLRPYKTEIITRTYTRTTYIYPDYYYSDTSLKKEQTNRPACLHDELQLSHNLKSVNYYLADHSSKYVKLGRGDTVQTWPSIKSNKPYPTSSISDINNVNTWPSIKSNKPYPTGRDVTTKTGWPSIKLYPTSWINMNTWWPSIHSNKPYPTSQHVTTKTGWPSIKSNQPYPTGWENMNTWPSIKSNKPYPTGRDVSTKAGWPSIKSNEPYPTGLENINTWPSIKSNKPYPTGRDSSYIQTRWPSIKSNKPYPTAKDIWVGKPIGDSYPHPTKTKIHGRILIGHEPENCYN